jgi:hypothetical protein
MLTQKIQSIMKNFRILMLLSLIVVIASSCTIRQKATPVSPILTQVNFTMDDLEYIGDVIGKTTQSYFLTIPYGGRRYTSGILTNSGLGGVTTPGNRGWNNALYDALMSKPDADFVLPVSYESTVDQMFLGSQETLTVRAKAYRIKNK